LSKRELFTDPDDLVFCSEVGEHIHDDQLRDRFYEALEAAGLGEKRKAEHPIVFHDLRHTFGTLAVEAWPLHDVQAYMGHADIQTTMIYVHHQPKAAAADRLSELVAKATGTEAVSPTVSRNAEFDRNSAQLSAPNVP
jgi:integrase